MYAIVEIAGQQFKVEAGRKLYVHRLEAEQGSVVEFDKVLLVDNEGNVTVGTPTVEGAKVTGSVVKVGKGPKLRIFKYKHKTNYRRRQGHRQPFTKVKIEKIES